MNDDGDSCAWMKQDLRKWILTTTEAMRTKDIRAIMHVGYNILSLVTHLPVMEICDAIHGNTVANAPNRSTVLYARPDPEPEGPRHVL